jgi:hypothetical protein
MPERPTIPSITAALDGAEQQLRIWTRARDVLLAARDVEQLAVEAPDRAATFKTLKEQAERDYAAALKRRDDAVAEAAKARAATDAQLADNRQRLDKALADGAAAIDRARADLEAEIARINAETARARTEAEAELVDIRNETQIARGHLQDVTARLDAIKASLA